MQFMIAFATFVPFFNYAFDTRHTHVIDYKFVSQQKRILLKMDNYDYVYQQSDIYGNHSSTLLFSFEKLLTYLKRELLSHLDMKIFSIKKIKKTKMSYSKYSSEYHPASFSSTYFLGIH